MIKKIMIISVLSLVIFTTSCKKQKAVWDYLDGNMEFTSKIIEENIDVNLYNPQSHITTQDFQQENDLSGKEVNLNDLTNVPYGVEVFTNKVKVVTGGTYIFSGNYTGNIIIEDCNGSDVRIVLNGATINTLGISSDATIKFKETTGKRILTVASGTVNKVQDSTGNVGISADEGVIVAKKSSLTINGSGKLIVSGVGSNSTGIKAKKELCLLNTNIEINALNNGIKAGEKIIIKDSNINVISGNDGIKTDIEVLSEAEALEYAKSIQNGYMYIKNSNVDITSKDDGLIANSAIYVDNNATNIINIVSNNGINNTNVEPNGNAIKVSGITYTNPSSSIDVTYDTTDSLNYHIYLNGGNYNLDSFDDAIKSCGDILINGASVNIKTLETSINGSDAVYMENTTMNISTTLDGIKVPHISLNNSRISINATDDGIVASTKDDAINDLYIHLNNSNVFVNALGKGLESKGYILMNSGNLIVSATSKDVPCVDTKQGLLINGGNFIAIGDYGQVENPSSSSLNKYVNFSYTKIKNTEKNMIINIYDNDNIIYSYEVTESFFTIVMSTTSFNNSKDIKIEIGDKTYDIEIKGHSILIKK